MNTKRNKRKMLSVTVVGLAIVGACTYRGEDVARVNPARPPAVPIPVASETVLNEEFLAMPVEQREAHAGDPIRMSGVKVQRVDSDFTFWVGPNKDNVIPVVLRGEFRKGAPEERVEVREGQTLNVSGNLRRVTEAEAELKLAPAEQKKIEEFRLYVSADSVTRGG